MTNNTLTLEQEYATDPSLLDFYKKKLLIPRWAGELTKSEAGYIALEYSHNIAVRINWRKALVAAGFTGHRRRKPSAAIIMGWNDFLVNH